MARATPHAAYDLVGETYALKRQNLRDKHWSVQVGDPAITNRFTPRVRVSRFTDGLIEFGVPGTLQGGGDRLSIEGDSIVWSRGIYTARFYDWEADPDDAEGNGSFEWELILASVPPVNSFSVDLNLQNVDIFYQPPLTAQEIADGAVRPERVVGSYAVYHRTKRDHRIGEINYEVGKVGHLYRPRVTDNNGVQIWGEWNTDAATSGQLTLTVDAAWLASAAYPVTIDPTFGFNGNPSTNISAGNGTLAYANRNATYQYTASSGDTLDSISCLCAKSFGSPSGRAAVYDTSSNIANNLLAQGTFTPAAGAAAYQTTGSLSASMTASSVYTVAWCNATTTANWNMYYDTGATNEASRDTISGAAFNDPWSEDSTVTNKFAMYATYTASASNAAKITAADASLTYTPVAAKITAADATATHGFVAAKITAADATATHGLIAAKITAADLTADYNIPAAKITAVDSTLTYTPTGESAKITAADASLTYTPVAAKITAADATATHGFIAARISAADSTLTSSLVAAKIAAADATASYNPVAARITAADATATHGFIAARISAADVQATYNIPGVRITAVDALLTYSGTGSEKISPITLPTTGGRQWPAMLDRSKVLILRRMNFRGKGRK